MIKDYIQEALDLKKAVLDDESLITNVEKAVSLINAIYKENKKILIAGNGGSAADAQHFAAEIVARFKRERKGYPAIALTTDSSIITAWSNDYAFETVFSRQVEALGQEGDVFIGISTSGNSKNIIEAVKRAKEMNITTICLLGNNGGALKDIIDLSIIVPSANTPRIQEVHTLLVHIISEEIEKEFN